MKLFSYGSIILPKMTKEVFNHTFIPLQSVFIKGFKLELQHANSKEYPDYHFILCKPVDNQNELIPGFLVEVPDDLIEELDKWEGSSYQRTKITCFSRTLEEIECEIYLVKS